MGGHTHISWVATRTFPGSPQHIRERACGTIYFRTYSKAFHLGIFILSVLCPMVQHGRCHVKPHKPKRPGRNLHGGLWETRLTNIRNFVSLPPCVFRTIKAGKKKSSPCLGAHVHITFMHPSRFWSQLDVATQDDSLLMVFGTCAYNQMSVREWLANHASAGILRERL